MKTILVTLLTALLLLPVSAIGEIQTITHAVKQPFGGSQSADDARIAAIAKAKREAVEMAGTYIESLTVVKNSQVDKDEILALAAGVLRAEVVSQENYHTKDAFGIDVVVKVVVDTSVLEGRVKKLLQDKTHLEQLNQVRKQEKVLLDKVASLEEENRNLTAKKQSTQKLKKEFQQASRGLTAVDWFYKAVALWDGGKYTDPKKAIEYLNNAIKLQPENYSTWYNLGLAYDNLKRYNDAIEAYRQALRINPEDALTWTNLGAAYCDLKRYNDAMDASRQALRIDPEYAIAWNNRGTVYANLKRHSDAVEAYRQALRLDPEYADAWNNLGITYHDLKRYNDAIEAYRQALRINPEDAHAWTNLGAAYYDLKRYNDAIEAYRQALRINPEDAKAWYGLGVAYYLSGNRTAALEVVRELKRLDPERADRLFKLIVPR